MCLAFFIAALANHFQTAQMLQNSKIEVLILRLKGG
jgi:hypothetical protein